MKVLVTGGAGFIGSNFVVRTLKTRPEVEVIVLDSLTYAGSLDNLGSVLPAIEFVKGDIRDKALVDRLVSRVDIVINFAAESHNDNSLRSPSIFFETNVQGTLNIATAAAQNNVRLHHVSTDEVFGDFPIDSLEEFTPETAYNPSSPYSASKAASDHVVRAWARSFGLFATISNCSNNYGPNQHWEKLIPASIKRILEGGKPRVYGDGRNIRDWIHVDDHTDGIWAILDKGSSGETYLLGARNRVDNLTLVRGLLATAGKDTEEFEHVEDRAGHDRRYAVDPTSSQRLGWSPKHKDVLNELENLFLHYSSRFELDRNL